LLLKDERGREEEEASLVIGFTQGGGGGEEGESSISYLFLEERGKEEGILDRKEEGGGVKSLEQFFNFSEGRKRGKWREFSKPL